MVKILGISVLRAEAVEDDESERESDDDDEEGDGGVEQESGKRDDKGKQCSSVSTMRFTKSQHDNEGSSCWCWSGNETYVSRVCSVELRLCDS